MPYNRLTDYSVQDHKLTNSPTLLPAPVLASGFITAPPVIENLLIYYFKNGPFRGGVLPHWVAQLKGSIILVANSRRDKNPKYLSVKKVPRNTQ